MSLKIRFEDSEKRSLPSGRNTDNQLKRSRQAKDNNRNKR